ncbi:hypothetical protein HUT18_04570 [Streptomyces sp. NA04227]|nr:hypothetical protein HUT18_04570 [Streptomyces sp. NA04227]
MRHGRLADAVTAALASSVLLFTLPPAFGPGPTHGAPAPAQDLFGAECRTRTEGSRAFAVCHNPYPGTDRMRLHIECARWWDVDSDSRVVAAGPAESVRLDGRCWKEIGSVWVSHRR